MDTESPLSPSDFLVSTPDMNKALENLSGEQLDALNQTLGASPSPLYSPIQPNYSPVTPAQQTPPPANNSNIPAIQKRFLSGVYTGAKNPYRVLGKHNIQGDWLTDFLSNPGRTEQAVTLSAGAFDYQATEIAVLAELQSFTTGTYANAFGGKIKGAIAKAGGNPKKLKAGLNKAIKDFVEEYYPNGNLGNVMTLAKRLRAQKGSVADPFQKAAFAHRIKQVDAIILKAKKAAITMFGINGDELYARAAAGAKSGLVYEPVTQASPYTTHSGRISNNWLSWIDDRKEKAADNGRIINQKTINRWDFISQALRNPANNLLQATNYRPKKSRRTGAIAWTDSINSGYADYDPYNLSREAFGDDYASSRYLKFKDADGKFKSVPRSVAGPFAPYADDNSHFIVLKRKELKTAIRDLASNYLPENVAEALRIEPELLDVLSECIDVYGRKLIVGLLQSYINLEAQTEKPSLKLGLSHLLQLFRSQEGMKLVADYELGDIEAAFAAGKESVDDWMNTFMPDVATDLQGAITNYTGRVRVPRRKAIADRITSEADRLSLLANRRVNTNLNRYMGLNDKKKAEMLAMTDQDYALNLGRSAWNKKKDQIDVYEKEKRVKLSATYGLSPKEVKGILQADPMFRHFSQYNSFDEAVTNGQGVKFYPGVQEMEASRVALSGIKSKYAGLDLKGLGPERKHEAALIRALYRQSHLTGDRLHMATSSQWFATSFIIGTAPGDVEERMLNSFDRYGVGNPATIRQVLQSNGAKYLNFINQLAIGPNIYNQIRTLFSNPESLIPDGSPEALAFAKTYLAIPGFWDLAVHLVFLQLFDQLKYASVNVVAPTLANQDEAIQYLEHFFTDQVKPEDLFSLVHGAAASEGFGAMQKLTKASSKEYDIAITTLMRNAKRDTQSMELFGSAVMKLPILSKLAAIIFGLSKTMHNILQHGKGAFIMLDIVVSHLASNIQGTALKNFLVAQTIYDELSGQTAMALGMGRYHQKPAYEYTYSLSKDEKKAKRSQRKAVLDAYKQFQVQRPVLQFRDAYKLGGGRGALTKKEAKQQKRKLEELQEQYVDNDVDMSDMPMIVPP